MSQFKKIIAKYHTSPWTIKAIIMKRRKLRLLFCQTASRSYSQHIIRLIYPSTDYRYAKFDDCVNSLYNLAPSMEMTNMQMPINE